jgi:DNA-binding beta-propeller fold protein YncE
LFVVFAQPDLVLGPHAAHASKRGAALGSLDASRLTVRGRTRLSAAAYETALTPDASKLIVTHFDVGRVQTAIDTKGDTQAMRAPVLVLDPTTLATLATRDACILPAGLAVSGDGTRAWVACYGEDVIGELHLDDPGFAFETFPVGPDPQTSPVNARYGPIAVSLAAGGALFVADRAGYDVRVIDLATHAPIAVLDTASGSPFSPAASADGTHFVFATREPEQVIAVTRSGDVWSKSASRELRAGECGKPGRAARWRDRWFIVCEASGALLEVDPDTLATRNTFLVGAEPTSVAFTPEGAR